MERTRFQGISNIIRFNWPWYAFAMVLVVLLAVISQLVYGITRDAAVTGAILIVIPTLTSLLVSYYIYDLSGLYQLSFLDHIVLPAPAHILNIHAGFDETSTIIAEKYPTALLAVFDFYDPVKHNEPSIQRARKSYPASAAERITTSAVPLQDYSADLICLLFAAHEIRDPDERIGFFRELARVLKPSGCMVVTEHLRDRANIIAYNLGALHFLPAGSWQHTFKEANLTVSHVVKITPFITTYYLINGGNTN